MLPVQMQESHPQFDSAPVAGGELAGHVLLVGPQAARLITTRHQRENPNQNSRSLSDKS